MLFVLLIFFVISVAGFVSFQVIVIAPSIKVPTFGFLVSMPCHPVFVFLHLSELAEC